MTNRLKGGFGQASKTVMQNPNIDLKLKGLYAYLSVYASKTTDSTFVSVNRIASECGIGVSTVRRLLKKLEQDGVILRTKRGKGTTTLTTLLK